MVLELTGWMEAVAAAAQSIAAGALGVEDSEWQHLPDATLPSNLCGVYIPLLTEGYALQLGVLGSRETCSKIARALLGMGNDEPMDAESEVFDAVGEIVNMVAGELKVRVAEHAKLSLGIPLALSGKVFPSAGAVSTQGTLRLGEDELWLILTRQQTGKRAKSAA
jgi:hypothetical protein